MVAQSYSKIPIFQPHGIKNGTPPREITFISGNRPTRQAPAPFFHGLLLCVIKILEKRRKNQPFSRFFLKTADFSRSFYILALSFSSDNNKNSLHKPSIFPGSLAIRCVWATTAERSHFFSATIYDGLTLRPPPDQPCSICFVHIYQPTNTQNAR